MTHHERGPLVLVDAHVHVYDGFDVAAMFDAALAHFGAEASRRGAEVFQGVLLLAETSRHHWHRARLAEGPRQFGRWRLAPHPSGDGSLEARGEGDETLLIVAGSQLVTGERLEALALCTDSRFDDGLPIDHALALIRDAGGLPVVPWAVGKWLGARGRVVSRLIEEGGAPLFLGDNSGRPGVWPTPAQFRAAARAGIPLLPGTDPLPLPGEEHRVGGFGFACAATLSPARPVEDLKRQLAAAGTRLFPYGRLERPLRFIRNQAALRIARAD